jgi:DNA-binding response OmpR family regulator
MRSVVVIEDNPTLADAVRTTLEIEGFTTHIAGDASSGIALVQVSPPTLLIVDLTIPSQQGYRFVNTLRDSGSGVPILAMTVLNDRASLLHGFDAGIDDCIWKPFHMTELAARVHALLRRAPPPDGDSAAPPIQIGAVSIWPATRTAAAADRPLTLRPREFDLLMALVKRRGRIVTRAELLRRVWGWNPDTTTHTVDTHISRVRRQIEPEPGSPRYILTVRSAGFLMPYEAVRPVPC